MMNEGSRLLKQWLARDGSPSQRQLSTMLPRVTQPMISNHTRGQQPPLRAIFLYQELTGIPPRAWLSDVDRGDIARLAGSREEGGGDQQARISNLEVVAEARDDIERALLTAPDCRRSSWRSAATSLLLAEGDLLR